MSTAIHDTLPADARDAALPLGAVAHEPPSSGATEETRTYRGRTVDELIPKIQSELGRDAIVIRRQSGLTGGFAGFFQRPYVEIEARRGSPGIDRYDEDDATPALPGDFDGALHRDASLHASGSLDTDLDAAPARPSALDEEFRELTAAGLAAEPRAATPDAQLPTHESLPAPFAAALAAAEAAASPQTFTNPQPAPSREPSARAQSTRGPQPAAAQAASAPNPSVSRSRARDAIERRLLEVGVGEQLVRELLETASGHVMPFMPARTSLARAVQEALRQRIPTPRALPAGNATIAVVGPGGSGKTSFCAALLEAYAKRSTLEATRAAVIDGEQRGALELVLAPHVPEPAPIEDPRARTVLHAAREQGMVLLDTPAVSPADVAAVRALAALLAELRADRVVLALPATLGASSANQLLEALRPLNADTIAVTHVNETDQLGVAVDAACKWDLAPAYTLDSGRSGRLLQLPPTDLAERLLAGR